MATQRKCKECKAEVPKGERMEKHWQEHHPEQLAAIKRWLKDASEKVKIAEIVAEQGMRGPGRKDRDI